MPRGNTVPKILLCLTIAFQARAQSAPAIFSGGIVSAASYAAPPLAPGSIAAAFGNFLLPAPLIAPAGALPTNLAGLSLELNTQPAPLFYASGFEVNFQVPWELAGNAQVSVAAALNGQTGPSQTLTLA